MVNVKETQMATTFKKTVGKTAFTLVELLTVMAIIALLIGLMVPALGHVKTTAKVVQQKAQLKSIETALEAFSGMYGDYPPSNESSCGDSPGYDSTNPITCGAQKLAEAVLGVDLRGFDPQGPRELAGGPSYPFDRRAIGLDQFAYAVLGYGSIPAVATQTDVTRSLERRKGPYITINESVNSFEVGDLFSNLTGSAGGTLYGGGNPYQKRYGNVICDSFKVKNITYRSRDFATDTEVMLTAKVGTPILYYKADPSRRQLGNIVPTTQCAATDPGISIYNWYDNRELVSLGKMTNQAVPHEWLAGTGTPPTVPGADAFYNYLRNPKIAAQRWPFNADSYILISAGPDGIYGNSDDITNFGMSEAR
jgi:prepilin-type N-terminal cleavage/methylation domain-containing protein